jgi:hypothetical protein
MKARNSNRYQFFPGFLIECKEDSFVLRHSVTRCQPAMKPAHLAEWASSAFLYAESGR